MLAAMAILDRTPSGRPFADGILQAVVIEQQHALPNFSVLLGKNSMANEVVQIFALGRTRAAGRIQQYFPKAGGKHQQLGGAGEGLDRKIHAP